MDTTYRLEYTAQSIDDGTKVIDAMIRSMGLSVRLVRKFKQKKMVTVNGEPTSVNTRLVLGDIIVVQLEEEHNIFDPEPIPVSIVYEDYDIIVVNKPANLVVHPTKGHPFGTLGNALAWYAQQKKENYKIRFVNRLDRDTTGLLIVAKNGFSQQLISEQMKENGVTKRYLALVHGHVNPKEGTINAPIDRVEPEDIVRQVHPGGKPSITHYKTLDTFEDASLLELELETGRTHQIRVHMSHLGHPLFGDPLYGTGQEDGWGRQALHAWKLSFETPRNGPVELTAELPEDFLNSLKKWGFKGF